MARKKLWGGRFKKGIDSSLKKFSYSLLNDSVLFYDEIEVNIAYAKCLQKAKLLTPTETKKIIKGLDRIQRAWKPGDVCRHFGQYEDIHAFIQDQLEKKVGAVGKKIHTGRSRNDLVVTSTKLHLRKEIERLNDELKQVERAILYLAKKAKDLIIPGVTHLKKAQPVLFAHHLLAYVEMLETDRERLRDAKKRINVLDLGSASLGGSALPVDRRYLAKLLHFEKVSNNSMASVSDRSWINEVLGVLSLVWMHLSRLSEDFILWNSEPFNFIELDDSFATGSSLMPQKKNPDVFELIRGRAGVVYGHMMALLVIQKGLPMAYNRDLQEDKPGLFDALHKTHDALEVLSKTLRTTTLKPASMAIALVDDTLFATDILEYLVKRGVAFSEGHYAVGQLVAHAMASGKPLRALELKVYQKYCKKFSNDVYNLFDVDVSVSAKKTIGSTHPSRVKKEIAKWEKVL